MAFARYCLQSCQRSARASRQAARAEPKTGKGQSPVPRATRCRKSLSWPASISSLSGWLTSAIRFSLPGCVRIEALDFRSCRRRNAEQAAQLCDGWLTVADHRHGCGQTAQMLLEALLFCEVILCQLPRSVLC